MKKYINAAVYQTISNHLNQTDLLKELWKNWMMDTWNIHYLPEEDEAEREVTIADNFNGDENEYSRWEYFEHWITFQDIENFIDADYLESRRVCFAESEFGTWIGVNSYYKKQITNELIDILFGYSLTEEDVKNLENGIDIIVEC